MSEQSERDDESKDSSSRSSSDDDAEEYKGGCGETKDADSHWGRQNLERQALMAQWEAEDKAHETRVKKD
jgi:hypothetical protein